MPHQKKASKIKKKRKIYRKFEDFYSAKDLVDPDALPVKPAPDAKKYVSHLANEQDYSKDEKKMILRVRKFCMKTDISRIREITRNDFVMYSTEQRFLEKKFENRQNEKLFKQFVENHELMEKQLGEMQRTAFKEMQDAHATLERVKAVNLRDELKKVQDEHQLVVMETQTVYARFQFLMKLICYFDDRVLDSEILKTNSDESFSLTHPPELFALNIGDRGFVTKEEMDMISNYMDIVVRPYLNQRRHLNADIWLEGFERTRRKISNYNKRFAQLALLNHIVTVIHHKFEKTYKQITTAPIILKDASLLEERCKDLQLRAHKTVHDFEVAQREDKVYLKLRAVVPVVMQNIRHVLSRAGNRKSVHPQKFVIAHNLTSQQVVLEEIAEMQQLVLQLLSKLDQYPSETIRVVERRVRREVNAEKQISKCALIKENRLKQWMAHFKKHRDLNDK